MSTPIRTALLTILACAGAVLFLVSRAPGSDSSSSSSPAMLSVCISPSGDYHCGLTTSDIKVRASTCGMPGPAEGDWSVVSVLGLVSHDAPVYVGSWYYEWTIANGLHPATGTVTISGAFSFAGGWANRVEEYELVTLTEVAADDENDPTRRFFATNETIRFKATSTPASGPLRCDSHTPHPSVTWQYTRWTDPQQTEPAQNAQWNVMTNVSADRRYAYLGPDMPPGFYVVRAQLCSASAWHQSPKVTITAIEEIKVRRQTTPPSGTYASTATIAAGGYDTPVHKADVKFKITPVPPGSFSVAIPVTLSGAAGHTGDCVNAKLYAPGTELVQQGNGSGTITFTNANTSNGELVGTLVSSNVTQACSLASGSGAASVESGWDTDPDDDWTYDPYVPLNVWSGVSYTLKLTRDGTAEAIPGHTMEFYAWRVVYFEWNSTTEVYEEKTETISAGNGYDLSFYAEFSPTSASDAGDGVYHTQLMPKMDDVYYDWFVSEVNYWAIDLHVYEP